MIQERRVQQSFFIQINLFSDCFSSTHNYIILVFSNQSLFSKKLFKIYYLFIYFYFFWKDTIDYLLFIYLFVIFSHSTESR